MIIETIANVIESQLNANANAIALGYKFVIGLDYKEYAAKNIVENQIDGVLLQTSGEYTPVKGASTKFVNLSLEFAVRVEDKANFDTIIESWSKQQLAVYYKDETTNENYVITPNAPISGTAQNTDALQRAMPVTIVLQVQITDSGLVGAESVWKINNVQVDLLSWRFVSSRTQQACQALTEDETSVANQMASYSIQLVIPVAKTDIIKALYNDILANNKDNVYKVEMSDGWSNGINYNCVITNGTIDSENTKINALTIIFAKSNENIDEVEEE